jgi:thymidylate kinase
MGLEEALERANARGESDRMERESQSFHARVVAAFDEATDPEWQQQHPEIGPVERVSALGTAEEVMQRCLGVLASRWPDRFASLIDTASTVPDGIGQ